jgi:hypothetical protein
LDAEEIRPRPYGGSEARFRELSLPQREIVVRIELNPQWGSVYSDLRDIVYRMVAASRTGVVELQFKNDVTTVATISGFVSKVEAPLFTESPEVQLTIETDDPMLRGPAPVAINVVGLGTNNAVIQDDISTAPHGLQFALTLSGTRAEFKIQDPADPTWDFRVVPVGGFVAGDALYFSSEQNNKYLYMVRGGTVTHLVDKIVAGSHWPVIFPGTNTLDITNYASYTWSEMSYRHAFWGV